jgi:hypothetical protein
MCARNEVTSDAPGNGTYRFCGHCIIKATKRDDYTVDDNGVARWESNNSVPPRDWLMLLELVDERVNVLRSEVQSEKDFAILREQYTRNEGFPSAEEMYEMEAAFGKGVTVVDVISGRVTRT